MSSSASRATADTLENVTSYFFEGEWKEQSFAQKASCEFEGKRNFWWCRAGSRTPAPLARPCFGRCCWLERCWARGAKLCSTCCYKPGGTKISIRLSSNCCGQVVIENICNFWCSVDWRWWRTFAWFKVCGRRLGLLLCFNLKNNMVSERTVGSRCLCWVLVGWSIKHCWPTDRCGFFPTHDCNIQSHHLR